MNQLRCILMLLPIFLDCVGNTMVGGSFDNTLSAEAWRQRDHKYWGWTHRVINAIFFWQENHCEEQHMREEKHGGVWLSWLADFLGAA